MLRLAAWASSFVRASAANDSKSSRALLASSLSSSCLLFHALSSETMSSFAFFATASALRSFEPGAQVAP